MRRSRHVVVRGERRWSRLRTPAGLVLSLALLVGLAVVLAPSAPEASAQADGPPPSDFVEGGFPCNDYVSYRGPYDGVYEKRTFAWSERLPGTPGGLPTYRFHLNRYTSSGGELWVFQPGPHLSSTLCDTERPTPGRPAPTPAPTPNPTPDPTPPPRKPLMWTPCGPAGKGLECATLELPMDPADAAGAKVQIALNRLKATDTANRIGSLVFNPGGPGASGTQFLEDVAAAEDPGLVTQTFGAQVRERFDIVGFDPRGVGRTRPLADCLTTAERDADRAGGEIPYTDAVIAGLPAEEQAYGAKCLERVGPLLRFMSTTTVARDLESIRVALEDEKLSFLGLSYGTQIGATYAALYPGRVRVMALDGAVSLDLTAAASQASDRRQMLGFQGSLDAFLDGCRTRPTCTFGRASSPQAALDKLVFDTLAGGRTLPTGTPQPLTQSLALEGILGSLYSQDGWAQLETALEQAEGQGRGSELLTLADNTAGRTPAGYEPGADTYTAVRCSDRDRPSTDLATYRTLYRDWSAQSRYFGLAAFLELSCAHWPVTAAERFTGPFTAAGAPPIVVIGTRNDPATPYAEAEAMAATLTSGVLLTAEGYDHTAYATNPCVQELVQGYLVTATPPARGVTCPVAPTSPTSDVHALLPTPALLPAPIG